MSNFMKGFEKFLLNLVVITLIVMISLQIVMNNDAAYQKLKELEFSFMNLFQENGVEDNEAVEVSQSNAQLEEGFIVIDLLQNYILPQVWLVKNGKRVADFSDGIVKLPVHQDDLLMLDCKFYKSPLWFEITGLSSNIRNWRIGQQFRINAEEEIIGVVQFYDQL